MSSRRCGQSTTTVMQGGTSTFISSALNSASSPATDTKGFGGLKWDGKGVSSLYIFVLWIWLEDLFRAESVDYYLSS